MKSMVADRKYELFTTARTNVERKSFYGAEAFKTLRFPYTTRVGNPCPEKLYRYEKLAPRYLPLHTILYEELKYIMHSID